MAVTSKGRTELQIPKKWKHNETSPERNIVWTEPNKMKSEKKVPVVYYLSRNGQLEHPHFMEVPLSSHEGLYLRDVINRLNLLRGKGMANQYSWSSKRSYRNGFVWHDLAENDFIYPAHGKEYVLKGSELLDPPLTPKHQEIMSLQFQKPPEINNSSGDVSDFPVIARRRNQSWSSIDLHEYKVYKTESTGESTSTGKAAADASTQTDDKRRRRRQMIKEGEELHQPYQIPSTELSREEVSPPPSDSSPETLESLMKADGRLMLGSGRGDEESLNRMAENCRSGRTKASTVLMQLLSCGSMSFKDCGAMAVKNQGLSLIGPYKARVPRGAGNQGGKEDEALRDIQSFERVRLEDKEYFSGSLIETKKEEVPALKRSSSYNSERVSHLQLVEKEAEGVHAKCTPGKAKRPPAKKNSSSHVSCNTDGIVNCQQGS